EVPSTTAGVLAEIRVGEGEVAPVGAIVAVIADGAGAAAGAQPAVASASKPSAVAAAQTLPPSPARAAGPAAAAPAPGAAPIKLDPCFEVRTLARNYGPAQLPGGTRVTPLARRLAAEGGIDLGKISPSGPHGRIVARDVEAARPVAARAAPTPAAGMTADQVKALYRDAPYEEVPLDGMRKTIAARLVMAAQTIPHFYLTTDVEIGALIKRREEVNAAAPKDKAGNPTFRLSLNDLVIKAWAAALQRVPTANAVWAEDRILRFQQSDIGVTVAIEGGLITP